MLPSTFSSLYKDRKNLPLRSGFLSLLNLNTPSLYSTIILPPSLLQIPPCPSLHHIKQAHARVIALGLSGDGEFLGPLLAAISVLPSPPRDYPRGIFDLIKYPNVLARNNIIRCYAKGDAPKESLLLYATMCRKKERPNNYTFPFLLQACGKISLISTGTQVHAHVVKLGFAKDVYIRNALIHFYGAHHELSESRRVFDENPRQRDTVTWNAILAGYARDGHMNVSERLFEEMPYRDVISWSTMIMGYVRSGELEKGLQLFSQMRWKRIMPNEAVLVTVLSAIGQLGLLERGQLVHSIIKQLNFSWSSVIGTALVDMYAKCGCIELSEQVFDEMPKKDVCTWNAMICGLATHGLAVEAMDLFQAFIARGLRPVNVTFIGVLSACSRAGLVDEGRKYFKSMTGNYGIQPEMEHYGCMVDILGRAGFLNEAVALIESIKVQPDPVLWGILLGSCKTHGLLDLGEKIGKEVLELDPAQDGYYVLLANIYAKKNKWDDVIKIRKLMVDQVAQKVAGWSLIEAQGRIHRFVAGDRVHERSKEIYKMLEEIGKRLDNAGYAPDVSAVLHDIGKEDKEQMVREHSERLAIAFGLLVTKRGSVIRIIKNLRICRDCHQVSKMISKVFGREIVVRDGSRFHHFKEGKCSCLDFW
ncbi:pentatricopeptide repeat-containing protein At5g66520-like [Aristolochia californica]|uniref:pentatricopeptide repeat-containing protein At5g66520-like n=1 Tax=Aristolochia californica TaxID=171875 RepID=UPI0035DDF38E